MKSPASRKRNRHAASGSGTGKGLSSSDQWSATGAPDRSTALRGRTSDQIPRRRCEQCQPDGDVERLLVEPSAITSRQSAFLRRLAIAGSEGAM